MADTIKRNIVHNENAHRPDPQAIDSPLEGAKTTVKGQESPVDIGTAWCKKMQAAFDSQDADQIVAQFQGEKAFWRDILNIDNSDFNTLRTNEIKDHLGRFGIPKITNLHVVQPNDAAIVPDAWVQCYLEAETDKTRIEGFVRLKESSPGRGDWKAFTFYTALKEVKGHEEFAGHRRPLGAEHGEHSSQLNWLEKLQDRIECKDNKTTVLIVGGGQNGLMLAARLTVLGIPNLIVEKNPRVGDSWRNRYHSLCLHDPIWADHFPYLKYPPSWPIYTPKDKIANWMESYASIMELAIWLESSIERDPKYNKETKQWTVEVNRKGEKRTMTVNHLVLATGFSGEPRWPSFPREDFKGTVVHSSGHKGGQGWEGKKAVVVGCCNSGHDIAQDFCERGTDVTVVQRSSTYVMSSKHGIPGLLNGVYEEDGPDLPLADLMLLSLPVDLLAEFHVAATKDIAEKDKDLLDGLTKAGFKLNHYPAGLFIKYFRDGGGYYIDVGASGMIAEGKIKIKQGVEVDRLTENGIRFADGTELPADIVVCATGYTSQRETIRRIISDEVADGVGQVWGEDSQGEIPGVWRHSGVPRFYLQSGNMFQARCYSRHLAQRILLSELGMMDDTDKFPSYKHRGDPRF